jgi:DNA-binding HxlR family transcriptional regulator
VGAADYQSVLKDNQTYTDQDFGARILAVTTKRTYGEACAAAHALDLVGERWALLVVRELLLGPKRFTDLRTGIVNASPNVLAERLRELEQAGVVRRRKLAPPAASWVYELTDWGLELEPAICALGRWGSRSPLHQLDAPMSIDSMILALRTMFDAEAAADFSATYELRLGESRFRAVVADGQFDACRAEPEAPDATIEAEPTVFVQLVFGGRPLDEAERAGDVTLEGDRAAVERFLGLFELPEPVELVAAATVTAPT